MTEREQITTQTPDTTPEGIWINPLTGRELGATLDDLIKEMQEKQK